MLGLDITLIVIFFKQKILHYFFDSCTNIGIHIHAKVVSKCYKAYNICSKMKLIRNESEIINNLGRLVVAFVSR